MAYSRSLLGGCYTSPSSKTQENETRTAPAQTRTSAQTPSRRSAGRRSRRAPPRTPSPAHTPSAISATANSPRWGRASRGGWRRGPSRRSRSRRRRLRGAGGGGRVGRWSLRGRGGHEGLGEREGGNGRSGGWDGGLVVQERVDVNFGAAKVGVEAGTDLTCNIDGDFI